MSLVSLYYSEDFVQKHFLAWPKDIVKINLSIQDIADTENNCVSLYGDSPETVRKSSVV